MLKYVAVILLGMSSNVFADVSDWDKTSKNLWYGYLALNVVDAVQTMDFIHCRKHFPEECGNMYETNKTIGRYPAKGEIVAIKVAGIWATKVVLDSPALSNKQRTFTLLVLNALYIDNVVNNHELGLRFRFRF